MLQEFKDFINRGNLVDLAIAVILATFFAPIVTALVDGVIMNIIAAIFGQPSFDSITIDVGDTKLFVGRVITAIVQFVIVAFVCFVIVKGYNSMQKSQDAEEAAPSEVDLLVEIRDQLRADNS
jgi:large conductance mechanosensitive channel